MTGGATTGRGRAGGTASGRASGRPGGGPLRALAAGMLVIPLIPLVAGCGEQSRTLDVLAAASLTDAFGDLAEDFERDHPGVTVRLSFGSSTTLAQQVAEGAPADVLATADARSLDLAGDAVGEPVVFASNRIVLVTPPAGAVTSVRDLDAPGVTWVACVSSAPCGALADELLAAAGVTATPASREPDVRAVLARVVADEADAGLVYASDAREAGEAVRTRPVPGSRALPTPYLAAPVTDSDEAALAADFVAALTGEEAQAVLGAGHGFGPPGDLS